MYLVFTDFYTYIHACTHNTCTYVYMYTHTHTNAFHLILFFSLTGEAIFSRG